VIETATCRGPLKPKPKVKFVSMTTVHVDPVVPAQGGSQPAIVESAFGMAVTVTVVPGAKV
jgi:hypothetical protein